MLQYFPRKLRCFHAAHKTAGFPGCTDREKIIARKARSVNKAGYYRKAYLNQSALPRV